MTFSGKLGPPLGAAVGFALGLWAAIGEMQGYDPLVRLAMPPGFALIGPVAGLIVWGLDRASAQGSPDSSTDSRDCCPRCGRRNEPGATVCVKCSAPLSASR